MVLVCEPRRAFSWLLGGDHGIQVWEIGVHPSILASVLISDDPPVVLLNRDAAGTQREGDAICWALACVAEREPGFYVLSR